MSPAPQLSSNATRQANPKISYGHIISSNLGCMGKEWMGCFLKYGQWLGSENWDVQLKHKHIGGIIMAVQTGINGPLATVQQKGEKRTGLTQPSIMPSNPWWNPVQRMGQHSPRRRQANHQGVNQPLAASQRRSSRTSTGGQVLSKNQLLNRTGLIFWWIKIDLINP